MEVYISRHRNKISDESVLMAYLIEKSLSQTIGMKSRGVKFANFQVLPKSKTIKSVLVECGFLSQRDEKHYLSSITGQRAIGLLLHESIIKFLGY